MENALRILPNTTVVDTTVTVRNPRAFGRSFVVGSCARSRSTLAAKSSSSGRRTRRFDLRRSRARRRSLPARTAATASAIRPRRARPRRRRAMSARASPHLNLSPTLKGLSGEERMSQKITITTLATSARTPAASRAARLSGLLGHLVDCLSARVRSRSSQRSAQANSSASIPSPRMITGIPGPGVTSMTMPAARCRPPRTRRGRCGFAPCAGRRARPPRSARAPTRLVLSHVLKVMAGAYGVRPAPIRAGPSPNAIRSGAAVDQSLPPPPSRRSLPRRRTACRFPGRQGSCRSRRDPDLVAGEAADHVRRFVPRSTSGLDVPMIVQPGARDSGGSGSAR